MFFYLLYNSTLLEKEIDEYNRSIKVLIYGSIAYIILHAILFVGGEEALLYSLKIYFWLFLILDFVVLGLMFNRKNANNKNIFEMLFSKLNRTEKNININNDIEPRTNRNNNRITNRIKPILKRRSVKFKSTDHESDHDSDSDSDSDIGTDIDLASFKESLQAN